MVSCRAGIFTCALLYTVASGMPVSAAQCADETYGLADIPDAPRFEDYVVPAEKLSRPASPVLVAPDAREFRTTLRQAAAKGPNFAGHFTVAVWGCGAACTDFGIVDARSGMVFFIPALRGISTFAVVEPDGDEPEYTGLRFRTDSRLLVVLGAPREDGARDGVAFYKWTGAGLKLLRFV
ncbi:MAG TPA: hypothetical protein VH722_13150, partial [Alphaproteobacteria bacterium]|nr:hypothetical protein [Alphaproteobacteria bacterium]